MEEDYEPDQEALISNDPDGNNIIHDVDVNIIFGRFCIDNKSVLIKVLRLPKHKPFEQFYN